MLCRFIGLGAHADGENDDAQGDDWIQEPSSLIDAVGHDLSSLAGVAFELAGKQLCGRTVPRDDAAGTYAFSPSDFGPTGILLTSRRAAVRGGKRDDASEAGDTAPDSQSQARAGFWQEGRYPHPST